MRDQKAYRQTPPFWSRLAGRRLSGRQYTVWTAAVVLLLLAEPDVITFVIGCGFVALGLALRIWTFGHLEKNHRLATTGPYAHSRNPAYLGSLAVLVGIAIAAGNNDGALGIGMWIAGALGIAAFFLGYLPRKFGREHARMADIFPGEARRHAANVPAFWPRLTPWTSGDPQRFCWRRLQANHEIVWPAACVVGLAAMWL